MTDRPCTRCHNPVLLEDGHLVYCSHCGFPQIFLSEELQEQIADSARAYNERLTSGSAPAPPVPEEVPEPVGNTMASKPGWSLLRNLRPARKQGPQPAWAQGVQYALLSAGIALALGLLSLLLPPVSLLLLLWVVSAPILTVGFFNGQARAVSPTSSGFAARLGLLTGLLVACVCALTFTLSLVLTRFVYHDAGLLDSQLAASFAQQRTVVLQRLGTGVQPTLDLFTIPEYRVGMLLSVCAISAAVYLFLSTVAGGIAGLLLRRRRSA